MCATINTNTILNVNSISLYFVFYFYLLSHTKSFFYCVSVLFYYYPFLQGRVFEVLLGQILFFMFLSNIETDPTLI